MAPQVFFSRVMQEFVITKNTILFACQNRFLNVRNNKKNKEIKKLKFLLPQKVVLKLFLIFSKYKFIITEENYKSQLMTFEEQPVSRQFTYHYVNLLFSRGFYSIYHTIVSEVTGCPIKDS